MYRDGVLVDQLESDTRNTGKRGLEHAVNTYYTGTFGIWDIDFNADFYQGKNRNEQIVLNNSETDATSTNRIKNRLVAAKLIATTSVWKGKYTGQAELRHLQPARKGGSFLERRIHFRFPRTASLNEVVTALNDLGVARITFHHQTLQVEKP